ncbi:Mu transposase domain-containing protein [Streptomyces acidicola]|uniref:Mu transposase domain-containing protein n=1 Tax=Streptomyces acidicola TaxID=2596892 RepID=UPI0037FFDD75
MVAFDGNFYSVPPGLPGVTVKVLHRFGEDDLRIVTAGRAVVACHRRAPRIVAVTVSMVLAVLAGAVAALLARSDRATTAAALTRAGVAFGGTLTLIAVLVTMAPALLV